MSEILGHIDASKAVPILLNRIDEIKSEVSSLETKKSNQPPISEIHPSELERDIAYNVAEIELLKNAVPEGQIEDDNIQFFVAVAEIQKSNEILRQQLQFSKRNLDSLNSDVNETQDLSKSLVEINKELSNAHKRREEERKKAQAVNDLMDPDEQKKARKDKIEKEQHDLTQKTRATIRIFIEIKTFLQALLPRIAPAENEESDSPLAMLLQHLWNIFTNEGVLVYTDISSLGFDIDVDDINTLERNFIIEANPKNKNEIRMVDFTH